MSTANITLPKSPIQQCAACKQIYRIGELICPHCGIPNSTTGKTRKIDSAQEKLSDKSWQRQPQILADVTVVFDINGQSMVLPTTKSLIIGRAGSDYCPDIDLTPFGAEENGISRQHLRLSRDVFIYAADLGSTNGTFINGQRLFLNSDCILNDGDDLRLGQLKVHVKFRW
jgi:pSer/pThr/pTyr-binding forkhead associated (FHA) protein